MPARVTNIRRLHVETVVATVAQARRLARNPNTREIRDIERVGPDQVLMTVARVAPDPIRHRRRLPFQIEIRAAGLGKPAAFIAAIIGAPLLLAATGWLIFVIYGDLIATAIKATAGILSVLLIAWVLSLISGRCPGLHCPGCGHK